MSATTAKNIVHHSRFPLALTAAVFLLKVIMYFLFVKDAQGVNHAGVFFLDSNDRGEYLTTIDNYFDYGSYSIEPHGEPYAGRLPGFIFPYMLFRAFFNQHVSNILLGVFAICFSLIATFIFSKFLIKRVKSFVTIVLVLLTIEVIPYFWHLDWVLHPYSLATSCMIICISLVHSYFGFNSVTKLLIIGTLLAWLFMLRGVTILFIPVVLFVLVVHFKQSGKTTGYTLRQIFLFLIPLIIMEALWVGRNYLALGKIVPLQTSFVPGAEAPENQYGYRSHTKYSLLKVRELINCWGGDNFWYFPTSDMHWFVKSSNTLKATEKFRPVVLETISPSDLEQLKSDIKRSFDHELTPSEHAALENKIIKDATRLSDQFREQHPYYSLVVAPFYRLKNFLFKNPVQDWPGPDLEHSNLIQKCIKGASALTYWILIFLFPVITNLKLRLILSDPLSLMLFLLTLAIIVTFTFAINTAHYTYFIFGYVPAGILCGLYLPGLLKSFRREQQLTVQPQ